MEAIIRAERAAMQADLELMRRLPGRVVERGAEGGFPAEGGVLGEKWEWGLNWRV